MKNHEDLARGLWRKGDSDLVNAQMCVDAERSLNTDSFRQSLETMLEDQ